MPAQKTNASKRQKKPNRSGASARPTGRANQRTQAAAAGKKAMTKARRSGMSTNLKVTLSLVVAAVAVMAIAVIASQVSKDTPAGEAGSTVVRPDSHRLNTATDGKVTVVEFLDFECAACGAAYPGVEKLRKEYGNRITYVVRYFPIASHPNAFDAAHAAEAAARQGKFEPMYNKLFDNQKAWGQSQQSQVDTFVGYARELGLDVEKFRKDMDSNEVDSRVRADAADGQALGVQGTPSFFVNGEKYEQPPTYEALKKTIDDALAQ